MAKDFGLKNTEKAMAAHIGLLDLDQAAAFAVSNLYRAANAMRNHLTNTVLRPHDLSWTGWVVLWVVWIYDGLESRHAAESAGISKGTLTGVVRTLESRGWISRRVDDADRRLVHLALTEKGLALMEELFPLFNAAQAQAIAELDTRGVKALTAGLRTMTLTLEKIAREPD